MPVPAHALAPSRLALISTDPVGCVYRRRSPLEVATNVVSTMCRAYPYRRSRPWKARVNASATPPNTSASVPGIGASQSLGASVAGSGGALSLASGADNAVSCDAATRPGMTDGSTSLEVKEAT